MKRLTGALLLAGGVVAVVRKRSGKAAELVDRAREAVPDAVKDAIPGTGSSGDENGNGEATRRYAAPAEAGSQPPKETGEAPSDDPQATVARTVASDPAESLHTKPHDLPADTVMPDVSDDDPVVREAETAAAADAGAIGGNVDALATDEPGFTEDPERRPVIEGSGDPDEQTPEELDRDLGGNRQTEP